MLPLNRACHGRNLRLLESIIRPSLTLQFSPYNPPAAVLGGPVWQYQAVQRRGAKTTTRKRLKELQQGALQGGPLPELAVDEEPQYPTVLQGAKQNMAKFDNCVLLTRVGNFYELYFEQAEEYGPLLSLKVGYKQTKLGPVPMAGFPFFQLDRFLKTLVQDLNRYVAICDEFLINVSGKVKSGGLKHDRRVTRVVTPGTLIDEKFLDPYENNFLLSLQPEGAPLLANSSPDGLKPPEQKIGLAWLDLSTGDFLTQAVSRSSLPSAITRIAPREIILPVDVSADIKEEVQEIVGHDHRLLTLHQESSAFSSMTDWSAMLETPVSEDTHQKFSIAEKHAGHRLLDYVRQRLQGLELRLQPPRQRDLHQILSIDRSSLRGLEILETARDGLGRGSLFHAVKRTVTKSGSRLLRDRLTSPSASLEEINDRLELVSTFLGSDELTDSLIFRLKRTFDVQRIVQKFALNKGDADDMLSLASAVSETIATRELLQSAMAESNDVASNEIAAGRYSDHPLQRLLNRFDLDGPSRLQARIASAIDEEGLMQKHRLEEDEAASVAALAHDVVLQSAPEELDSLPKSVRSNSRSDGQKKDEIELTEPWIMRRDASDTLKRLHDDLNNLETEKVALAETLRRELKAPTLMLKSTPGLGYICHIRSATGFNKDKLESLHAKMVSSSKSTRSFYLNDWTRLGRKIDQAILNIREEEKRIFASLRELVIQNLVKLRRNASIMDELDVASAFATLAKEQSWVRPILNNGTEHKIIGGRHPMVKLGLEEQGRSFVSNNLVLDHSERVWLVTGPNMGGKSTFLRQNALITILAQTGSYVPATYAELGIVDQLFSRIGAADDLFRDQSTFMVEMLETAAILKHATPRSFVIMDEVGRGTTPEDGTAVGYASLHHLYHVNKCRTLFATHFHALADMTRDWPRLACYCTDVLEDESGSFAFMHRLKKGINRQSHALKVAKLAGLPPAALKVAEQVLQQISNEKTDVLIHAAGAADRPAVPAAE
ncbi:MutS protein 1 [Exophiala dermatitidis]|uniref:DNA mismatch repair protein MSH3 n=1 Tax=Exophiala dermatitidis TaxID=5970 RepID=A0AAN6F359_EXODE|nr:MutS protein 1 [Exophiala dermatitidis]KAJ4526630.1 MutS protein 1 [Exophiala dermatitidis]KAJ4532122.1 MutS protein 1 [Exophiala dermatitidis]KAJ4546157.1 MutS protein 1 [Exophiala dermatitidis]KAJ4567597.1 MutS protein 1 [Exophiala dermatitidis]